MDVTICGLQLVHPFFYVDADIPALDGYDLLRAAQIMIDAHAGEVWSKHTNVAHQVSSLDNIFVTVPSQSVPAPCVVAETTSFTSKDVPLLAHGETTHHVSSAALTSCVQKDTSLIPTGLPLHSLNPLAPSFDPTEMETDKTETELTSDEIPDHVNLLYETTVAQTRLTSEVDKQFRDVLRRRATIFAKDSTDLGFCTVLQHDVDTGNSPPIKQSPRRPPSFGGEC